MLFGFKNSSKQVNLFNLGTEGSTSVNEITEMIIKELNLKNVKIRYTGGIRGWPGDVHTVSLSIKKLRSLGWKPKYYFSNEAARAGVRGALNGLKSKTI